MTASRSSLCWNPAAVWLGRPIAASSAHCQSNIVSVETFVLAWSLLVLKRFPFSRKMIVFLHLEGVHLGRPQWQQPGRDLRSQGSGHSHVWHLLRRQMSRIKTTNGNSGYTGVEFAKDFKKIRRTSEFVQYLPKKIHIASVKRFG